MTTTVSDAEALVELIEAIEARDALNVIERAVVRTRMAIADREQAEREADPEYQRRMEELRMEADREQREWLAEQERREADRERRLASAPVLGTFTFGRIRPAYLNGKTIEVVGVNEKSYKCNVPDSPEFKTWRGRRGIRCPKSSGTFVAGATL